MRTPTDNWNYCWNDVLIEDKVAPTCVAPWDITVDCDEKNLAIIEDKAASAAIFGDVSITTGSDCANLDTVYRDQRPEVWVWQNRTQLGIDQRNGERPDHDQLLPDHLGSSNSTNTTFVSLKTCPLIAKRQSLILS
ncbi:MAG: hypothetical protein IPO07_07790 [Haliscomenobacter sp.]|nr:hypothetical protein [Haliscomenobacter sp.]MBK9488697.1 hypothetical protein [Haliscomenobacter sp.]